MSSGVKQACEGGLSIRVDITASSAIGSNGSNRPVSTGHNIWGPWRPAPTPSFDQDGLSMGRAPTSDDAPEKKLTLFALHLAILEKSASGLGALAFVWATVVLLGGFAIILRQVDFWFVTFILVIEGTRIYSRSRELEWQHQATWSLADIRRSSYRVLRSCSNFILRATKVIFNPLSSIQVDRNGHGQQHANGNQRPTPPGNQAIGQEVANGDHGPRPTGNQAIQSNVETTWHSSGVPAVPYLGELFIARNVSRFLVWLQVASAIACITLALTRIIQQDYNTDDDQVTNKAAALNLFYGMALAEALLFLLEKGYWTFKVNRRKLFEAVSQEAGFGPTGLVSVRRFFYDAYAKSIGGSVFDGLKMDLINFAEELLMSGSHDEHLTGVRMLHQLATSPRFGYQTLRKLGTSPRVVERLIEMLSWKSLAEEERRRCAAEIVSRIASQTQNALRVAGIPGAMESISSLLHRGTAQQEHKASLVAAAKDVSTYEYLVFNLIGLEILKNLANDHENCAKIRSTSGLLSKIVDFTWADDDLLRNTPMTDSIKAVKRSLQVVKMLVSAKGNTGKALREDISKNVFMVSNIREILRYGERHRELQKLAIQILTGLAMDEAATERIATTGGLVKLLLSIFFAPDVMAGEGKSISDKAGEALVMLILNSEKHCKLILQEAGMVERLIEAIKDPALQINSLRILRNLCAYTKSKSAKPESGRHLGIITDALPMV